MGTDKANATRDVADGVVDGVVDSREDDVTGSAAHDDKAAGDQANEGRPVAETGRDGDRAAAGTDRDDERANAESAVDSAPTVEVSVVAEADSSPPQVTAPAPETPPADDVLTPPLGTPAPPPQQGDWQAAAPEHPAVMAHASERDLAHPDDLDHDEEEWYEEYQDAALFAAIFSAPSLALAAFVFALTGLLGGMIPQSLPYLVDPLDPQANPAFLLGLIMLGFAIVAASLGLAAMLRSIGSPLNWPRYLGGAAVLLALLMALQSVLLIVLAGQNAGPGGMS